MSSTIHYRLDQGASSVVAICSLCDWRGLGLDRDEAQAIVRRHIVSTHPATKAAISAENHLRRAS